MNFEFPISWVDIAIVIFLVIGVFRGRKHGLSQELFIVAQWIVIVIACAFLYKPIGEFLVSISALNFSLLFSYIVGYVLVAILVKVIFVLIKGTAGGKLAGSDVFGAAEYYFGMVAGLIRYLCMVIFALALINSKLIPTGQAQAIVKSQTELYGQDYFGPFRIEKIQAEVFGNGQTSGSFIGGFMKSNFSIVLIQPTPAEVKEFHQKDYDLPE
jgi:uncharacterized membrane protein required for colicin V production